MVVLRQLKGMITLRSSDYVIEVSMPANWHNHWLAPSAGNDETNCNCKTAIVKLLSSTFQPIRHRSMERNSTVSAIFWLIQKYVDERVVWRIVCVSMALTVTHVRGGPKRPKWPDQSSGILYASQCRNQSGRTIRALWPGRSPAPLRIPVASCPRWTLSICCQ